MLEPTAAPLTASYLAEYVEALLELGRLDEARADTDDCGSRPRGSSGIAGRSRRPSAVAGSPPQPRATSAAAVELLGAGRRTSTRPSAIRSVAPAPSSRSASRAVARGRSARPARRSRPRSPVSRRSEPQVGRRRREGSSAGIGGQQREEGLTPAERRVAKLVAEGKTNREVAAALFLGEAHRRDASHARLREARHPLPDGARPLHSLTRQQSSGVLALSSGRGRRRSVEPVPSYLVETYLASARAGERGARERRARSAAEEQTRGARASASTAPSTYPEDEICFFVFDAPSGSAAALRRAAGRPRAVPRRRGGLVRRKSMRNDLREDANTEQRNG